MSRLTKIRARALMPFTSEPSKDLDIERQRQATADSARFIDEHMAHIPATRSADAHTAKLALLEWAVGQAPSQGLAVEFGVATGETLKIIADVRPAHGFDSFEGLPEHWYQQYREGAFAQVVPKVSGAEIHVGWFEDTLPEFLNAHPEPFAFVHMDADLYSSTHTVFDLARDRFTPGTVIAFDEFFNYPGWKHHEHRAFTEFIEDSGHTFDYVGYNALHEQVVVRLT